MPMYLEISIRSLQDLSHLTIANEAYLASFLNIIGQALSLPLSRELLTKLREAENLLAGCECSGTVLGKRLKRIISGF